MEKTDQKIPLFRVFTLLSLAFLVGIALASYIRIDFLHSREIILFSILLLVLVAIFNILFKSKPLVMAACFFIFVFLGIGYYSYFDYKNSPNLPNGKNVEIEGQIVKKPELDYKKQKVIVRISKISENRQNVSFKKDSLVQVNLPHFPSCHYGDQISFNGVIEKPGMIEDFDWGKYLKRELIFGVVIVPQNPIADEIKLNPVQRTYKALYSVSENFEASLNQILPEPHASLAAGLILGIKRNIPDDFLNDLNIDGLTHIIALSGYNVTIIVEAFTFIMLGLLSRKQVFWVGALLIAGFVVMTGAASSVVRAAIFSLMIILGRAIGRQGDFTNLMLLAAIVMILVNPFILANDIGFQLSFLAFAGLIYLSPIVKNLIEKSRLRFLPNFIKILLIGTLAAQIAVFPLILIVFGRASLIGPIANVAVLWIIPWAMGAAFFAGLLGLIYYPLGKLATIILWPMLEYIIKMVGLFAKMPFASFQLENKNWLIGLILYLSLAFLAIYFAKKHKLKLI